MKQIGYLTWRSRSIAESSVRITPIFCQLTRNGGFEERAAKQIEALRASRNAASPSAIS
ncbi:hypothetical protein [Methylosinus sp. Ce-a6]|uniref:hypothetical protein n=1 Tax=Methylosinus sp. Ce-a6 TaxID=2172005 RepID=UPI0013593C37|nr:hypothetical protein [Methylosinus sp. Ce-a6]